MAINVTKLIRDHLEIIVYAVHSSRPEVTAVGHSFGMGDGWTVGRRSGRRSCSRQRLPFIKMTFVLSISIEIVP